MRHTPAHNRPVGRLAAASALALTACLSVLQPAVAEPVPLDGATLANNASWELGTAAGVAVPTPDPTHVVREASVAGKIDALDAALGVAVGGESYGSRPTAELAGSRLAGPAERLAGLRTTVTYEAVPGTWTLRVLVTLENRSRKTVNRTVRTGTDLGSDDGTVVLGSSDGDTTFTAEDRWVVSADSETAPSDPIVSQVLAGRGGRMPTKATQSLDYFSSSTRVAVPARDTRHLLYFLGVAATSSQAEANVGMAKQRVPEELLGGLDRKTRKRVVNWDL